WSGRDGDPVTVSQLREIAGGYSPRLGLMLSCMLIQRLVRLGRIEEARAEATLIGLGPAGESRSHVMVGLDVPRTRECVAAGETDLMIAAGQLKQAETLIGEETRLARKEGRVARLVELALSETVVAVCTHHAQSATKHLVRAVSLA